MLKVRGLSFVVLLAGLAQAQDRQFPRALGAGIPPLQQTPRRVAPPMHASPFWGGNVWGGYAAYPEMPLPPVTNVVVFEPPPAPPLVLPPPEPIHSSIQELKPAPSSEPPVFFVIALKDGSRLTAAAVWVQGNDLRYVDADDQNRRVPLAAIDRTATRELNQARNLNLRLPPAQ